MADRFGAFLPHDTSGDVAQLHGIGLQKFGDTWYAYGENKVNGNLFQGVCCYTTTDFIAWRSHGIVLDVQEDGSALAADRIVNQLIVKDVLERVKDGGTNQRTNVVHRSGNCFCSHSPCTK